MNRRCQILLFQQHPAQPVRKQAGKNIPVRKIRGKFPPPGDKGFCLLFRATWKKVDKKLCFFPFMDSAERVSAQLKHRDTGYSVICELKLSRFLTAKSALHKKTDLSLRAHSRPSGKFPPAFQSGERWKKRHDMMTQLLRQSISASVRSLHRGSGGAAGKDHRVSLIVPSLCVYCP